MKKVYIAHPLRGNKVEDNVQKATEICRAYAERKNIIPVSPLHAFGFLDPMRTDPFLSMQFCFGLLKTCDEIWVHGDWWTSEGCQAEIAFAGCNDIPIRFIA